MFCGCALQRHNAENSKQIFPRNCVASVPISTFMCLWCVSLFCYRKICGPILGLSSINRSQTHECGNWDWGRVIPFMGIHNVAHWSVSRWSAEMHPCSPLQTYKYDLSYTPLGISVDESETHSGWYSETGFNIDMDHNFVCLWRRHHFRSRVIDLSLSALISWFMKSIIWSLNNSNLHAISTLLIINLHWV